MKRPKHSMARITVGVGPAADGAHLGLATKIADFARDLGYRLDSIRTSKAGTTSRYITLLDRLGHRWTIRVSDHRKPTICAHPDPHLDLVSLDGVSGFDEAARYLGMARCGGVDWTDPVEAHREPLRRRR